MISRIVLYQTLIFVATEITEIGGKRGANRSILHDEKDLGKRARQSKVHTGNSELLTFDNPATSSSRTNITPQCAETEIPPGFQEISGGGPLTGPTFPPLRDRGYSEVVATRPLETTAGEAQNLSAEPTRNGAGTQNPGVAYEHILEAARLSAAIARLAATTGSLCANLQAKVEQVLAGDAPPDILQNIRLQVKGVEAALFGETPDLGHDNTGREVLSSETLQPETSDDEPNDGSEMDLESSSESDSNSESGSSDSDDSDAESSSEESENSAAEDKPSPKIVDIDEAALATKPKIRPPKPQDHIRVALLRERIKDFMPKMEKSKAEMERKRQAGTLKTLSVEEVEGDERVIEMNLGLGVLEEKQPPASAVDGIVLKENKKSGREPSWLDITEKRFPTKPHPGIQEVMEHLEKNEVENGERKSKDQRKWKQWKKKCERLYHVSAQLLAQELVSYIHLA